MKYRREQEDDSSVSSSDSSSASSSSSSSDSSKSSDTSSSSSFSSASSSSSSSSSADSFNSSSSEDYTTGDESSAHPGTNDTTIESSAARVINVQDDSSKSSHSSSCSTRSKSSNESEVCESESHVSAAYSENQSAGAEVQSSELLSTAKSDHKQMGDEDDFRGVEKQDTSPTAPPNVTENHPEEGDAFAERENKQTNTVPPTKKKRGGLFGMFKRGKVSKAADIVPPAMPAIMSEFTSQSSQPDSSEKEANITPALQPEPPRSSTPEAKATQTYKSEPSQSAEPQTNATHIFHLGSSREPEPKTEEPTNDPLSASINQTPATFADSESSAITIEEKPRFSLFRKRGKLQEPGSSIMASGKSAGFLRRRGKPRELKPESISSVAELAPLAIVEVEANNDKETEIVRQLESVVQESEGANLEGDEMKAKPIPATFIEIDGKADEIEDEVEDYQTVTEADMVSVSSEETDSSIEESQAEEEESDDDVCDSSDSSVWDESAHDDSSASRDVSQLEIEGKTEVAADSEEIAMDILEDSDSEEEIIEEVEETSSSDEEFEGDEYGEYGSEEEIEISESSDEFTIEMVDENEDNTEEETSIKSSDTLETHSKEVKTKKTSAVSPDHDTSPPLSSDLAAEMASRSDLARSDKFAADDPLPRKKDDFSNRNSNLVLSMLEKSEPATQERKTPLPRSSDTQAASFHCQQDISSDKETDGYNRNFNDNKDTDLQTDSMRSVKGGAADTAKLVCEIKERQKRGWFGHFFAGKNAGHKVASAEVQVDSIDLEAAERPLDSMFDVDSNKVVEEEYVEEVADASSSLEAVSLDEGSEVQVDEYGEETTEEPSDNVDLEAVEDPIWNNDFVVFSDATREPECRDAFNTCKEREMTPVHVTQGNTWEDFFDHSKSKNPGASNGSNGVWTMSSVDLEAQVLDSRKNKVSEHNPGTNLRKDSKSGSRKRLNVVALLFLMVGIGAGVGIGLVLGGDDSSRTVGTSNPPTPGTVTPFPTDSSSSESKAPTQAPLSAQQSSFDLMCGTFSDRCDLIRQPNTAQNRAIRWLNENRLLEFYSDEIKIVRFALATFYHSTGGNTWTNSENWLSDTDVCLWYSTKPSKACNDEKMFVHLELDNNNVQGTIPVELSGIKALQSLSISNPIDTFIEGRIPPEFGAMTNMETFVLSGNKLTGTLPTSLGDWSNLRMLNLNGNRFTGTIPRAYSFRSLTSLDLGDNLLYGDVPASLFSTSSKLVKLVLAKNSLRGRFPASLGELSSLETLQAADNEWNQFPLEVTLLSSLVQLDLSGNVFGGLLPPQIGNLSSLRELFLNGCNFSGGIPPELSNLTNLERILDLSDNSLLGTIPSSLGNLVNLRRLFLQNNKLSGGVPSTFASMTNIKSIRLESNSLTGTVPEVVCDFYEKVKPVGFIDCDEITALCFSYCCLDGGDCQCRYIGTTQALRCFTAP